MNFRASRKEFSNDPTQEMSETSTSFESAVKHIKMSINKLEQYENSSYEVLLSYSEFFDYKYNMINVSLVVESASPSHQSSAADTQI